MKGTMSEQTLIIENLPADFEDVRLKLDFYFRNEKKSGGEVFKIIEHPDNKQKALLVYQVVSGVNNVLERVHQIDFGDLGMFELIVKMHGNENAQMKQGKEKSNKYLVASNNLNTNLNVYAEEDIAVRSMEEVEFIESFLNLSEIPEIKKHGVTIVACGTESSPYLKVTAAKEYIREVVNVVKRQLSLILVEKHTYSKAGESKVLKKNEANAKAKAKELHCSLHLLTEQPRKCGPTKSFTHKINSCITLTVTEGDLLQHSVDALICPVNSNMLFDNHTTRKFLKAGGFQIQEVCRRLQREKQSLLAGEAIISEPGNLPAKTLIYAVLPTRDQSLSYCYLQSAIHDSLQKAEERNSESFSMPVVGCETFGFSVEESCRAIMEAIQQFCTHENTPKTLRTIFVVDSDVKIVEEFNTFITQLVSSKVSRSSYPTSPTSPFLPSKPKLKSDTSVIKDVEIDVKTGDITRETVQAIVNTTNSTMDFKSGVSGAIFRAAGSSVKKQCKKHDPLKSDTVAVTSAGNLQCNFIIHMMGPQSAADVRLRVKKVLEKCEEKKISTISFPALGTGLGGVKGAEAIDAMLQGFEDHFSQRSFTAVKLIYIVVSQDNVLQQFHQGLKEWITNNQVTEDNAYNEESDSYEDEDAWDITTQTAINQKKQTSKKRKLKKADIGSPTNLRHIDHVGWDPIRGFVVDIQDPVLKQLFYMCGITDEQLQDKETSKVIYDFVEKKGGVGTVKMSTKPKQTLSSPAKQPLTLETETSAVSFPITTVEVYGTSAAELAEAKKFLHILISDECTSKEIQSCHLAHLPEAEKEAIVDLSQKNQVHILMSSPDKLTVSGKKDDVLDTVLNIHSFIQATKDREIQENEENRIRETLCWEVAVGDTWEPLKSSTNYQLEVAFFNRKEQITTYEDNGETYTVDFKEMKRFSSKGTSCRIKRTLLGDSDTAIIQTPPTWTSMDGRDLEIILLVPDSEEHKKIEDEFRGSSPLDKWSPFQVLQIRRIQNKGLWQRYAVLKQEVDKKYPTKTNEQFLYHGTTKEICQKINKNGFNRSFCGRNAVMFGEGTYFAKEAWYSCQDKYSNPDESGVKYIYRARVVTGLPCQGQKGMKEPDLLNPNDTKAGLYDCAVDNLQNPSIYVVFCDAGAYPDHLIILKTI